MTLERLNPNSIVELDDPMSGGRKLALVDETGVGYYDILGMEDLPKPIHSALHPADLGEISAWHVAVSEQSGDAAGDFFLAAWEALTEKNLDVLTIARGLRWGMQNASSDIELMANMGQALTDHVLAGRAVAAKVLSK